ncbi:MAG: glycosyltransferase family 4 protein [Alphaproteobacteria bacterium]|nr:glycosyltransferase family 4 protein [Alphaproteobacteria bacterium]
MAMVENLQRDSSKKTVLFVHQSAELYGSDKMLLQLLGGLDRQRITPLVVLPEHGPLYDALKKDGVEIFIAPVAKIQRAAFSLRGFLPFLVEIIRSVRMISKSLAGKHIDWVHSNTLAVFGGALWAKLGRVPHLWHVHEIIVHPTLARRFFPVLLRYFANKIVANSQATADTLFEVMPRLVGRTEVIHNGQAPAPPPDLSRVAALRGRFGLGDDGFLVTLVGRINRWKGQELFIEAAEIVLQGEKRNIVFLMVGGPPPGQEHFVEDVRKRIHDSPVRDNIKLMAFTDDIWNVWHATDIAVVPSTEPEPFGMVAVEAMAAGKPVVAANHGGLSEIVIPERTGLFFEPGDVEGLAKAITTLVNSPDKVVKMGELGRMRVENRFNIERYCHSFEKNYLNSESILF